MQRYERSEIEIVSGCSKGADKLGERYAQNKNISIKHFPAKWNLYGKKAGFLRNEEMAKYATHAIIFWDQQSKGSKLMIDLCETYNLIYKVVKF